MDLPGWVLAVSVLCLLVGPACWVVWVWAVVMVRRLKARTLTASFWVACGAELRPLIGPLLAGELVIEAWTIANYGWDAWRVGYLAFLLLRIPVWWRYRHEPDDGRWKRRRRRARQAGRRILTVLRPAAGGASA